MSVTELPTCISLVLCDDAYRDERTQKVILVGIFNTLHTAGLPFQHPRMTVFFSLTEGRGEFDLRVQVEHEASGQRIFDGGGRMTISDPLAISDVHLELHGTPFHAAGKYWVQIVANGEIIQQRPFFVEERSDVASDA